MASAYDYNGKQVYLVSENDLQHAKASGSRIRVLCPVHMSRDRDASVNPWLEEMNEDQARLAGWGHCKSGKCGATFLVQEWNAKAASRILGKPVSPVTPRITMTTDQMEQASEKQLAELQALNRLFNAGTLQNGLNNFRAAAYLAGRGIQGDMLDVVRSLEVGYIPPIEEWKTSPAATLKKWGFSDEHSYVLNTWCDRIIFPYTTPEGDRGFIGRTLQLWQPGMDENEHKRVLKEHNDSHEHSIIRWRKTHRSGFFHASAMQSTRHIYCTEGPFDAIPLIYGGLAGVVALAGTHLDTKAIPKTVLDVTIAFDADIDGSAAREKFNELLGSEGIAASYASPPDDELGKDWSERYRRAGLDGLSVLLSTDYQYKDADQAKARALRLQVEAIIGPVDDTFLAMSQDQQETLFADFSTASSGLCSTCLDARIETPVPNDDRHGYGDLLYCDEHNPGRAALLAVANHIATVLPDLQIKSVHHISDWPAIKAQLIEERRAYWIRHDEEQRARDRARLAAAHTSKVKRYSQTALTGVSA